MKAHELLDALEKSTLFKDGPHLMLREVRNGTGSLRQERYADGLCVSLWPSRGIWFAGIEVKVVRSDWLHELRAPAKSAEIQKWCNFWWLATAPNVAKPEEIPEMWGWVEVSEKGKTKVLKRAPRLAPEPLTSSFVAAVLRNRATVEQSLVSRAKTEGREEAIKSGGVVDERRVQEMERELNELRRCDTRFRDYCAAAGLPYASVAMDPERVGKEFALAQRIIRAGEGWGASQAFRLRKLADELEEAEALAKAKAVEARVAIEETPQRIGEMSTGGA